MVCLLFCLLASLDYKQVGGKGFIAVSRYHCTQSALEQVCQINAKDDV